MTKREYKKLYPEGPPAYYILSSDTLEVTKEVYIFCAEECRMWVECKGPRLISNRNFQFVKNPPVCFYCNKLIWDD